MRKSRERAVSGTEIVEAITYLLITCAVISLFIYYSFIAKAMKRYPEISGNGNAIFANY